MVLSSLYLILWFVVVVSSVRVNTEKITEQCSFKGSDKNPTYLYKIGANFIEIPCSNNMCSCDGSNYGYPGCQKCCCGIRERSEGNTMLLYSKAFQALQLRHFRLCFAAIIFK